MSVTPAWHTRPIFITSTFRDMHAERDYLRTHVFPELEERLKARRTHLEPIDLRWGVETVTTDEEHAKEMLVLKVCLAEVERSRPFLIGLIGDRYGWIPPEERMAVAAQEAGFEQPVAGRSVTDLEINFGVLDSPEQQHRSFFYYRDPLPYDEMSPQLAAEYSDVHNPKTKHAAEKLTKLKEQIKKKLPDRVRQYHAEWDAAENEVTDLEEWGKQVLEDLWQELDAETAEYAQQGEPTWQETERWILDAFLEGRARNFIGREQTLKDLKTIALSPEQTPEQEDQTWGVCVSGPAGAGKSALLAELNRQLQGEDVLLLTHAAGISIRSNQVDAMLRRWIEELAQHLDIKDPIPEDAKVDDIEQIFQSLLGRTSTKQRVVVLIDALNQFERTTCATHLTWLPKLWPPNARFIATAIPGSESEALTQLSGAKEKQLEPLSQKEASDIANAVCLRYRRKLHPEVLQSLINKKNQDNQPAAGNALWLELAVEELNLLDADDFARADKEFTGKPEQKLHQLLITTAKELPADIEGLYGWMLKRSEDLFGEAWAQSFVNLIAVSRYGWRESDLQVLMPKLSGEPWNGLKFAALRRTFRAHVVQRGSEAQWDFAHAQMRSCIMMRNLMDIGAVEEQHLSIADYLENLPRQDQLRETETMVHLIGCGDKRRAALNYASDLSRRALSEATNALAGTIMRKDIGYSVSLLNEHLESEIQECLVERYVYSLLEALKICVSIPTRLKLAEAIDHFIRNSEKYALKEPVWQELLSSCAVARGDLFESLGDLEAARSAHQSSLSIREHLASLRSRNSDQKLDAIRDYYLAQSYQKIGDILWKQKNLQGSRSAYEEALMLVEQYPHDNNFLRAQSVNLERLACLQEADGDISGALSSLKMSLSVMTDANVDHRDIIFRTDLAVKCERFGDMFRQLGNISAASYAYKESLKIRQELASNHPEDPVLQRHLSASYQGIGWAREMAEDLSGAQSAYESGISLLNRLIDRDPIPSTLDMSLLGVFYSRYGDVLEEKTELEAARAAYVASLAMDERILMRDPKVHVHMQQSTLAIDIAKYAAILERLNDPKAQEYQDLVHLALIQQKPHVGADEFPPLWLLHTSLGLLLEECGQIKGVRAAYSLAARLAESLLEKTPDYPESQEIINHSLSNLQRVGGVISVGQGEGSFKVRFPD